MARSSAAQRIPSQVLLKFQAVSWDPMAASFLSLEPMIPLPG